MSKRKRREALDVLRQKFATAQGVRDLPNGKLVRALLRDVEVLDKRCAELEAALRSVVYADEDGVLHICGEAPGGRHYENGLFRSPWRTGRINEERVRAALSRSTTEGEK